MKSYRQYCPIAKGAEVFAERWTPLIVRNLHLGADTFSQILAGAPGMPRSLLTTRLAALERIGVIERQPKDAGRGWRYLLTPMGEELVDVCFRLGEWGARWLEMRPEDYDPYSVLWAFTAGVRWEKYPGGRTVVELEFADQPLKQRRFWLLLDPPGAEVCVNDPGYEPDVTIRAETRAFVDWHIGRTRWTDALDDGSIVISGPGPLARSFPTWNPRSHFVAVEPVAR